MALPKKRLVLQHLRALAVIPGKENGKSQGRRERGMSKKEAEKDRRKEKQQR